MAFVTRQTAALRDGDGRIQVWALNTGAVRLAHVLETAPNSDSFSAWSSDSSVAAGSDPALVANADSHL